MHVTIGGEDHRACQVVSLERIAEPGDILEPAARTLRGRTRLVLRRRFSPSAKRKIKEYLNHVVVLFSGIMETRNIRPENVTDMASIQFRPGDKVRVRPKDQIQATLNCWNELRGCSFLPEMWQYCGTVQRILKPVRRFVDERDCRLKKVKGVYLLEGVICQGFELYGQCDRACFYFWREEWLQRDPS